MILVRAAFITPLLIQIKSQIFNGRFHRNAILQQCKRHSIEITIQNFNLYVRYTVYDD